MDIDDVRIDMRVTWATSGATGTGTVKKVSDGYVFVSVDRMNPDSVPCKFAVEDLTFLH